MSADDRFNRYDFANGIGLPLVRSGCMGLFALLTSLASMPLFNSGNAFFVSMGCWFIAFHVLEKRRRAEREAEQQLTNRFLGIDNE